MFAPIDASSGFHFRRYNAFILLLGMVRPMQVHGIWERDGSLYNPFMAQLLSPKQYYVLRCNIRPDVVELPEECNGQWAGAWWLGGAACGDESVVPHKGIRAGRLRMFIARKPHPTGIKLYCLADATMGCSVLGRGAEPPQFWVLLIWLEPGISHVTWVHYDATMCLPCFACSILPVLHFLRFDLCVL